ncbi:MAG: hypothetical protein NTZ38_00145 [Candidatus Taylorbacteria bacterium]|nr:hypothetical protein [Candidatus Taylorbacteria bacterium]
MKLRLIAVFTAALLFGHSMAAQTSNDKQVSRQRAQEAFTVLSNATYKVMHSATPKRTSKKSTSSAATADTLNAGTMNGPSSPAATFWLPTYHLPVACDCIQDQRVTYGVPEFTDDSWLTSYYNWDISSVMFDPTKTGQAAMSQSPGYYPAGAVDSQLWRMMPNYRTFNGDPCWFSLKFWYQYYLSWTGDQFSVGTENGSVWLSGTNMPTSGTWMRAEMLLLPYNGTQYLMFDVHKAQRTSPFTGPRAYVAAVQLCPINTNPTPDDFIVRRSTNNTMVVAWNIVAYPPPRYVLSSTTNLVKGGSSHLTPVTNLTVQYTNLTAYVVVPANYGNGGRRFFSLTVTY